MDIYKKYKKQSKQKYKDYETYKRERAMKEQAKQHVADQPEFETDEDEIPSEPEVQDLDRVALISDLPLDDEAEQSKSGKPDNIDTSVAMEKSPLFEDRREEAEGDEAAKKVEDAEKSDNEN